MIKFAEKIKIFLQMTTGLIIAILLIWKFCLTAVGMYGCSLSGSSFSSIANQIMCIKSPLELVGKGLMYSAGFELAYMLFTPGPDEAIEPVMLALAAAVLLIVSDEEWGWADAAVAPLLCLSIGFLFFIRKRYILQK